MHNGLCAKSECKVSFSPDLQNGNILLFPSEGGTKAFNYTIEGGDIGLGYIAHTPDPYGNQNIQPESRVKLASPTSAITMDIQPNTSSSARQTDSVISYQVYQTNTNKPSAICPHTNIKIKQCGKGQVIQDGACLEQDPGFLLKIKFFKGCPGSMNGTVSAYIAGSLYDCNYTITSPSARAPSCYYSSSDGFFYVSIPSKEKLSFLGATIPANYPDIGRQSNIIEYLFWNHDGSSPNSVSIDHFSSYPQYPIEVVSVNVSLDSQNALNNSLCASSGGPTAPSKSCIAELPSDDGKCINHLGTTYPEECCNGGNYIGNSLCCPGTACPTLGKRSYTIIEDNCGISGGGSDATESACRARYFKYKEYWPSGSGPYLVSPYYGFEKNCTRK